MQSWMAWMLIWMIWMPTWMTIVLNETVVLIISILSTVSIFEVPFTWVHDNTTHPESLLGFYSEPNSSFSEFSISGTTTLLKHTARMTLLRALGNGGIQRLGGK